MPDLKSLKDLGFASSEPNEQILDDKGFTHSLVKADRQKFDDLIKNMPPHIPSPIEKTNKQLEILVNESLSNSTSGKRWNWITFLFSVVSIGIAINAFNSSSESSRKLEEILHKHNDLLEQSNKPVAVTVPSINNVELKPELVVNPSKVVQDETKALIVKESGI
jgi:hypothetical protein